MERPKRSTIPMTPTSAVRLTCAGDPRRCTPGYTRARRHSQTPAPDPLCRRTYRADSLGRRRPMQTLCVGASEEASPSPVDGARLLSGLRVTPLASSNLAASAPAAPLSTESVDGGASAFSGGATPGPRPAGFAPGPPATSRPSPTQRGRGAPLRAAARVRGALARHGSHLSRGIGLSITTPRLARRGL